MQDPVSKTSTIPEDKLTFFSLARPSQLTQRNIQVEITALPSKGRLYQAQFEPGSDATYSSLATTVDQFGPMDHIVEPGTLLQNDRGIVMYIPGKDETSASPDTAYANFSFHFVNTESGLVSD